MKRLILLVALVMAMAVLAPAAFADDSDTDGIEGADVEMEEKEPSVAQLFKAKMIADYFAGGEADPKDVESVIDIRTGEEVGHAVGWGVMYKVMLCVGDGLASFASIDFESGWAVGELCRDYDGSSEMPRNFGQFQKENKPEKHEKATPPGQLKKAAKIEG